MTGVYDATGAYRCILADEFDLASELNRLRASEQNLLARALEHFFSALLSLPPRWSEARTFGQEVANLGHEDRRLETLRNSVIRALSPMLDDLPATMTEMLEALEDNRSKPANALAAARIIRIFGNDFDPH